MEPSIRDLILQLQTEVRALSAAVAKAGAAAAQPKLIPQRVHARPLAPELRDAAEMVLEEVTEQHRKTGVRASFDDIQRRVLALVPEMSAAVLKNGEFNASLRNYCAERAGIAVMWASGAKPIGARS